MCIRDRISTNHWIADSVVISVCTSPVTPKGSPVCMVRGNISVEDLVWYKAMVLILGWNVRKLGVLW